MQSKNQWGLEIRVPQNSSFGSNFTNWLKKFPYRDGDWFDQTVGGMKAPTGVYLVYIRLAHPLSEEQKAYLEQGKNAHMILSYSVTPIAGY